MSSNVTLNELGDFLKRRRSKLSPLTVGLPSTTRPRRVEGLRREEVAQLASISTDYYTRLEQGRMQASAPVLDKPSPVSSIWTTRAAISSSSRAKPRSAGRAGLVTDFSRIPEKHRNYPRLLFMDPVMRGLCADGETAAQVTVAQLRMEAAKYPEDPRLIELVGELFMRDKQFAKWWGDRCVASRTVGTKTLNHPVVGELVLDWDTLTANTDPDQNLTVWTAAPGSATRERLRILASWAADQNMVPSSSLR